MRSESGIAMVEGLVSVIIPAYNAASLIEETLHSVLAQTHTSMEVIVVDDGSTDQTADVVGKYAPRVQLVRQANSGGCSSPRNHGLRVASGEFVTFFDADDIMDADKIARQVACFLSNPEIVAAVTDYRNFVDDTPASATHFQSCPLLQAELDRVGQISPVVLPGALVRTILLEENFNISNSPLFRTRALREELGAFDEELKASEDYELIYRVAGAGPIGILRDVGFHRRMHAFNMSNRTAHILKYKILSRTKLASMETDAARREALLRRAGEYHLGLANHLTGSRDRECWTHLASAWKLRTASTRQVLRTAIKWVAGVC